MTEPQKGPDQSDEPDDSDGDAEATLDGTHERAFPVLDVDNTDDTDDE